MANPDRTKCFELAISFFGALPDDLKLRESVKVSHQPAKLLPLIDKYAKLIEARLTRE